MPQLDRDTYNEIFDLLEPLTESAEERAVIFKMAFIGIHRPRVDVQAGTQAIALDRMIRKLFDFGTIGNDNALWILLQYLVESNIVGDDKKVRIQALKSKINNASTPLFNSDTNQIEELESPRQDFTQGESAIKLYNRGIELAKTGQYIQAISYYDRAIEIDRDYAAAYNNRGNAYQELGQYTQAILDFTRSITLNNPHLHYAYTNRGNAYHKLERYLEAISDYNRALEIDKNYSAAYHGRATAYASLKQYMQATIDYTRAIELDSTFAASYIGRGIAFHLMGIDYFSQAISDLEIASRLQNGLERKFQFYLDAMRRALNNR